jgi:predicted transcriptional regulator
MTAEELRAWRAQRRLSRPALARELDMSESRLVDYELGVTRGSGRPATIPKVVELALAELARRMSASPA